jgi:putative endonuclease
MYYFVYIIYSCSLDIYYKGQTANLADRIKRHNSKQEKATLGGVPWVLVWSTCKQSRAEAVILEQKLKNLSRKRLLDFMWKYPEGFAGPDVPDRIVGKSGC